MYFSMDWEIFQSLEWLINTGWKKLSYDLEGLFAHANTIELLNYITINGDVLVIT